MTSHSRLEVQGKAPFRQSGVYEVQISLADSRPSDENLRNKQFSSLWRANFHLRVKDGMFAETLGSDENPIPSSVYDLDTIWIIVTDLFSSLHSVFDVSLGKPSKTVKPEIKPEPKSEINIQSESPTFTINHKITY